MCDKHHASGTALVHGMHTQWGGCSRPLALGRTSTVYSASLVAQMVKNLPAQQNFVKQLSFNLKISKREKFKPASRHTHTQISACNAGNLGSIPGSGRSLGEKNGNPLQYSCLENPMDRGAWWATVHWGCKESDMTERLSTVYKDGNKCVLILHASSRILFLPGNDMSLRIAYFLDRSSHHS